MTYLFDTDTTGPQLGDSWNIGTIPNGGYVMAASARALRTGAERDGSPHPHPVTVTTHYLRPTQPGQFDHTTELLRTGRTFSTAQGGLWQEGKLRVHTLATFGDLLTTGFTNELGTPPDLPPPEECIGRGEVGGSLSDQPLSSIGLVTDVRMHPDTGWIRGEPTGTPTMTGWIRFTDGRPIDPWGLLFFPDAFPPTVFELFRDRAWVPTIEMTVHVRANPVPGWIRASFVTKHIINGRFEEHGELWDEAGNLVAESRQLAMMLT